MCVGGGKRRRRGRRGRRARGKRGRRGKGKEGEGEEGKGEGGGGGGGGRIKANTNIWQPNTHGNHSNSRSPPVSRSGISRVQSLPYNADEACCTPQYKTRYDKEKQPQGEKPEGIESNLGRGENSIF